MKKIGVAGVAVAVLAIASAETLTQRVAEAQEAKQSQKTQDQKAQAQRAGKGKSNPSEPMVLALTTVVFAESSGCWARIFDEVNYGGRALTLMGAQALPNLEFGEGNDWEGDIDSVQVGPKARLALFDDEDFTDDKRDLGPNTKVAEVHKSLFDEGIESIRLSCTDGAK